MIELGIFALIVFSVLLLHRIGSFLYIIFLKNNDISTDMKLYIAVLDEVPDNIVPCLVVHSALLADRMFADNTDYQKWFKESFKTRTVTVNRSEFNRIRHLPLVCLGHENSTLGGEKSCAIVCPSEAIPNVLRYAKSWSSR